MTEKIESVRVRIAPSPTGNLHVGTARAALFNELFAKKHGDDGCFIIRVEDTDPVRSKPEFEENILEGLRWLGLNWQEGPDIGGTYGPYRQSERTDEYTRALQKLLSEDKAYKDGEAILLRVEKKEITFQDIVRGTVTVHTDSFEGDFVIARSSTDPLFHVAVVCDDEAMQITHVIRGEDHLHNTIKHILLQEALGYARPLYAHLPLLLDEQRKKLSKRSGETSLLAYRDMGILPQAMLNYLVLLGWNPGDNREYFTHEGLAQAFSLERVQKGGAIFSLARLLAMNKHYLLELSDTDLLEWATTHYDANGIAIADPTRLLHALKTELGRFASYDVDGTPLHEAMSWYTSDWNYDYTNVSLTFKKKIDEQSSEIKKSTRKILHELIETITELSEEQFTPELLQQFLMDWIDKNGKGRGDILWPLRVALTGREHSPGPFEVASVIGRGDTLRRLKNAHDSLA